MATTRIKARGLDIELSTYRDARDAPPEHGDAYRSAWIMCRACQIAKLGKYIDHETGLCVRCLRALNGEVDE